MSSTFSNLKFELIGNGEQSGTWGTTTNSNIGTAIEQAIVGMATLDSGDFSTNVCTLTLANTTAAQDARALCLNIAAGAVSAAGTINVPAIQKPYIVINGSSFTVTVKVSGQTGVAVPAGKRTVVYNNGTDVGDQLTWLPSATVNNTKEIVTVSATVATGTVNYDAATQSVLYYTSNASANWTVNIRASSSATLDSTLNVGESLTIAFLVTQGATAYYNSAVQVDGASVTPKWQGGSAPSSGNVSSVDTYSYTVIKTASATFTVLASLTQFK
jgi:hypothetical protein